jgi:hypothetical protein
MRGNVGRTISNQHCNTQTCLTATRVRRRLFGFLTSFHNIAGYTARALTNQIFPSIFPGIGEPVFYRVDSLHFRSRVGASVFLSYVSVSFSLLFLALIPRDGAEARARVSTWNRSNALVFLSIALFALSFTYGSLVHVHILRSAGQLSVFRSLAKNIVQV